jgi:methionine synthase I (cobalamin-dependent)
MKINLYKKLLSERILVFDGAMGTNLQLFNPTVDDYGGKEGCTEMLCYTHPDWLKQIHAQFFDVGCDFVETNSFGANRIVLGEYDLQDKVLEFNRLSAKIAREVAAQYSTPSHPRFVAGSMGPGTKLPSLGHTDFDTLRMNYAEQAQGLLEGGVDLLLIETCQDLLQVKAAINGALDAQRKLKIQVLLNVQVTIESTGTMLLGSDMATAITVIECFPVDTIGLNCATGPFEMSEHVRTLGQLTDRYISVLPNAGLPENVGGKAVYKLTPADLATHLVDFISQHGVNVVGGCCGTTPEHLRAVVNAVKNIKPIKRNPLRVSSSASLYLTMPMKQEPAPLIIGERTNANGSKLFRELLLADDYDSMVNVAKDQEAEGAHQAGFTFGVATLGTALTRDHAKLLKRYADNVVMFFDADQAGRKASLKGIEPVLQEDLFPRIVWTQEEGDPDEIINEKGAGFFLNLLDTAPDFLDYVLRVSSGSETTLEGKAALAKQILQLIGASPNEILKADWTRRLGLGLGIDIQVLEKELRTAGSKTKEAPKPALPAAKTFLPSAEEEYLQLLLNVPDPDPATRLTVEDFADERHRRLMLLLDKQLRENGRVIVADLFNEVAPEDKEWFLKLAMEDKTFDEPEERREQLARDIRLRKVKKRFSDLGERIKVGQGSGAEVAEFQELFRQIKGKVQ